MDWLIANKEWVFSGAGIFIIGLIITFFSKKDKNAVKQKQSSGNNSVNIQVGGDLRKN